MVQNFQTVPAFTRDLFDADGKPLTAPEGLVKWGSPHEPPAIGETIVATINKLGRCKVLGYFVEENYLGLLVKLLEPPAWHVKQNASRGYTGPGHLFGPEWRPLSNGARTP